MNKKAVFINFRGNDQDAINYWNAALSMKKTHQDSVINLLFHRWKSAQVSDQDVIEYMDKVDSINEKDSSLMLKALFMIAVGEKSDGLTILKRVLQGMKSQVGMEENKEENEPLLGGRETQKDEELTSHGLKSQILPIFHGIQLHKDKYFQNVTLETDHAARIWDISVSSILNYLVTTSCESVIIWQLFPKPKKLLQIDIGMNDGTGAISCIDSRGTDLFCYKQYEDSIMYFKIDLDDGSFQEKDSLPLPKDFIKEPIESLEADGTNWIEEIYFANEGKTLRWVQQNKKNISFADFDIETGKSSSRKAERFEDKSVYRYGLTYVQHHDSLNEFIKKQENQGNQILFPLKDFESMVILEKDNGNGEHFLIYDIFNERVRRKIKKPETLRNVYTVDPECRVLIFAKNDNICIYSLEIPEDLDCFIKPVYFSKDHNRNPGRIVKEKDRLWGKIMSLLKLYKKAKSKKFLIRIRKMMYKWFDNPALLSYNNAFLTLYKTLIEDDDECERIDIVKTHRTMIFNEIKFSNDLHKIRNIALPSNPDNNYLLLSIDGVIHKYDISTKELIFSFKASAYRAMQIFDNDNRILTCDSSIVKIWNFQKDEAEIFASLPIEDKIDKFYAQKINPNKSFYYVGVFQEKPGFKVYKDKLSEYWNCKDKIEITAVEFTLDGSAFLAGTDDGTLHFYEFKDKTHAGERVIGRGKAINFINVINEETICVSTEEPSVYICQLHQEHKEPYQLDTTRSQVKCMKTSYDRKHLVIGFDDSVIEFWKYHDDTNKFELLKEIKEDFQYFDIDSLCSSILILNAKWRDIEFHLIEWEWDTRKIEDELQKINLDFENIREEDITDDKKPKLQINNGKGKKRSQTACCCIF